MTEAAREAGSAAIVLAAGKGTRMGAEGPKVLLPVAGRPMVRWVIDACREAGAGRLVIVVGHRGDEVRAELASEPDCTLVDQGEPLGTGHAVQAAASAFDDDAPERDVWVVPGDAPLVRGHTLARLREHRHATGAALAMAAAELADPTGYGRVIRDASGRFERIVEQREATPTEAAVREINPSFYCFDREKLFAALPRLDNDNRKGEYYLTDLPGMLRNDGEIVSVLAEAAPEEALGANTAEELAEVDRVAHARQESRGGR